MTLDCLPRRPGVGEEFPVPQRSTCHWAAFPVSRQREQWVIGCIRASDLTGFCFCRSRAVTPQVQAQVGNACGCTMGPGGELGLKSSGCGISDLGVACKTVPVLLGHLGHAF